MCNSCFINIYYLFASCFGTIKNKATPPKHIYIDVQTEDKESTIFYNKITVPI
jgi:hypothetical protein